MHEVRLDRLAGKVVYPGTETNQCFHPDHYQMRKKKDSKVVSIQEIVVLLLSLFYAEYFGIEV